MKFEWNPAKSKENERQHDGITFKEAAEVFLDENAFEDFDDEHSKPDEKRFLRIGNSSKRLLRVSFTIREDETDDEIVRIISARKGKKVEERKYHEQNK